MVEKLIMSGLTACALLGDRSSMAKRRTDRKMLLFRDALCGLRAIVTDRDVL